MNTKILFLSLLALLCTFVRNDCKPMFQSQQVMVGPRGSGHFDKIVQMLVSFEIDYKEVDSLAKAALDDDHLYIIFDVFKIVSRQSRNVLYFSKVEMSGF